jgi:DNA-binding protein HU-beta
MNEVLNKKLLADKVAEAHNLTKKEANEIVELVFDTVKEELKNGNKVDFAGFGKFEVKTRNARVGINPSTKEKINVPASKVPGFKAAKALKDAVK